MTYLIFSASCRQKAPKVHEDVWIFKNEGNRLSPCTIYQLMYMNVKLCSEPPPDVLVYIHDDVTLYDDQTVKNVVAGMSTMPEIAVVGLGGAPVLGSPHLYTRPYALPNMARAGYVSNQTDWSVHGDHLPENNWARVAVVDAFFIAVRVDFLDLVGGWPVDHLTHHCLDLWLACEAARHGKQVWAYGASCTHHGGGTSTREEYNNALWLQGGNTTSDHTAPHCWLYETYRDVLPIDVNRMERKSSLHIV